MSAQESERLTIAMVGTRGVPASYGGFETAVEEIGRRLAAWGHEVVVYTRGEPGPTRHLGMRRVLLPALRRKQLETLSHTGLSVGHMALRSRPDVAFVFNAANAPYLPLVRRLKVPAALHMDGLEWRRAKWGANGRRFYLWAEGFGVRWADALIADAQGIADYYREQFDVDTELIAYGAPVIHDPTTDGITGLGLAPNGYHLVVARFEPENHVLEIVQGYADSSATMPLVVVGSAPYSADYTRRIESLAAGDERITLLGGVWDQDLLDALYAHAFTYVHGHSVGGTNPSLLRAIGAGTSVIAFEVGFNREILGDHGRYFDAPRAVGSAVLAAEADPADTAARGDALREVARARFSWDQVARDYEDLARRLASGQSQRRGSRRRARRAVPLPG